MITDSKPSALVSMYTEATSQLDGLADQSYLSSFLESTGDEPQCLRTTHSSMYPLWSGSTLYTQRSSSTRYQWRELYAAWKLAIPSQNWQAILAFPKRGGPYIRPMDWMSLTLRSKLSWPLTASTTYICAKKSSLGSYVDTLHQSYD